MRPWLTHWTRRAARQLAEIPDPWTAARIDAAVMEYAATDKGDVCKVKDDARGMWLRESGYVLRLQLYDAHRIVSVRYVFNPNATR